MLRAELIFEASLFHKTVSLFSVTFEEKVLSLHKSRGCCTQCGRFQLLLILELWGISLDAWVIFGLGKEFFI